MVEVERIDRPNSFITILKFKDGNAAQEIPVFIWEVDNVIQSLKKFAQKDIDDFYIKEGKETVLTW